MFRKVSKLQSDEDVKDCKVEFYSLYERESFINVAHRS